MTYHGHVENGVIVLDEPAELPDGTKVEVHPIPEGEPRAEPAERRRTLYDVLKPVMGKARGLPPDASTNHDHYLYGMPKRKP